MKQPYGMVKYLITKCLPKDYILLEYDAAVWGNWVLKFWRKILPSCC